MMTWLQRYRIRSMLQNAIWVLPCAGLALALIAGGVVDHLESHVQYTFYDVGPEGARALVAALVGATFSFIVFVFSVLLVAVQIASAQLSPRVITSMLRDPPAKLALAVFVFTFAFDVDTLAGIEQDVPQLAVFLAVVFTIVSIGAFLLLLDYAAHALRPVSIAQRIGDAGVRVIEAAYRKTLAEAPAPRPGPALDGAPTLTVQHTGPSGTVMAFDVRGLVQIAEQAGCVIVMAPQAGDFVARGELLCEVHGPAARIDPRAIRHAIAVGPARTLDHDPAFAFRVLVDIAARALSPAVNDPTTAVLMLDQLQRLLRAAGMRRLDVGQVHDASGALRLVFGMPGWDDLVQLAVSEVRLYGIGSLQIPRRMRAMLTTLIGALPPERHAALHTELRLLDQAVARTYTDPDERARANVADLQGMGGSDPY